MGWFRRFLRYLGVATEYDEGPHHGDAWVRSDIREDDRRIAVVLSVCAHTGQIVVSGYFWQSDDPFAIPLEQFTREWTRMWVDASY